VSAAPRVAYVLTNYPCLAMTFISGEIDEIRRRGGIVLPVSMNRPSDSEMASTQGRQRAAECRYLKSAATARAFAALFARHPLGVARVGGMALRSARSDVLRMARRLVHVAYAALVVEHCRANGVSHLHAHFGQSPASIAWFAAELGNLEAGERWTWSMTAHGADVFSDSDEVRADLKVEHASFVVAISDFTRSQMLRYSDPRWWSKVKVVRCGIDLDAFPRRNVEPDGAAPLVTTVGRLAPEKGQTVLIDALAELRDRGITARVELIGAGPLEQTLRAAARARGIEDCVDFVGELPPHEVAERLRRSAVFCLPSFAEGLPVAMMEAMAMGTPVVATHVNGIPELAVNGRSALTVAPGDAQALAGALETVLADAAGARCRADEARRLVEVHHEQSRNVGQLIDLLVDAGGG
jgi:colanic acid/amylovoran biosynthesis glycosyltransferase